MTIKIEREENDAEVRLAKIVAQFVREGVTFAVHETSRFYVIEMLGGY